MNHEKDLQMLQDETILCPKVYSFDTVRRLLRLQKEQILNTPMGVTEWWKHGEKYKYLDYFKKNGTE